MADPVDEREPTIDEVRDTLICHDADRRIGECEWCDDEECWGARVMRALLRRMEEDAETVALVDMLRSWVPCGPPGAPGNEARRQANEWLARKKT